MSPVLASSRPILIVSAAAALPMNGRASGAAAIAAAPSSAWRRGTTRLDFPLFIFPPPASASSISATALRKQPGQVRRGVLLGLRGHAHRGIGCTILLVIAATLDDFKEKSIVERIGVGVQKLTRVIAIVQQVELLQGLNAGIFQSPLRPHII